MKQLLIDDDACSYSYSFLATLVKDHLPYSHLVWNDGPIWAHMGPYEPHVGPYGPGPHIDPYEPIWIHMDPICDPYGAHMDPYVLSLQMKQLLIDDDAYS